MDKREIIKASLKLADDVGWKNTSVRNIAKAIGYSTIKIYSEFQGKDGLYHAIQEEGFKMLKEAYVRTIKNIENGEDQLIRLSLAHYRFAIEQQKYYELMFKMGGTNCEVHNKNIMFEASQPIRDAIFKICGKVDQTLFFNWYVIAHGFIVIVGNEPKFSRQQAETMLRQMIDNFIKAIKL